MPCKLSTTLNYFLLKLNSNIAKRPTPSSSIPKSKRQKTQGESSLEGISLQPDYSHFTRKYYNEYRVRNSKCCKKDQLPPVTTQKFWTRCYRKAAQDPNGLNSRIYLYEIPVLDRMYIALASNYTDTIIQNISIHLTSNNFAGFSEECKRGAKQHIRRKVHCKLQIPSQCLTEEYSFEMNRRETVLIGPTNFKDSYGSIVWQDKLWEILFNIKHIQSKRRKPNEECNNAKIELDYGWKTDECMVAILFKRNTVEHIPLDKKEMNQLKRRNQQDYVWQTELSGTKKGYTPIPVKRTQRALAKKAIVIPVDEFRTSITCCKCHRKLDQKYEAQALVCNHRKRRFCLGIEKNTALHCLDDDRHVICHFPPAIYRLKQCKLCPAGNGQDTVWQKDINAAIKPSSILVSYIELGHKILSRLLSLTRGGAFSGEGATE
ncbi:hypothetical protein AB4K20DRAFT_1973685 [Rhizopus microsporus]|uniref:Uncharacterized protein n=1 Tax=Rhizopus microsporus TaxID=58291 RepID=A0A1X0RVP2_RHIZD|nr:hypothetical protein BCV71DRAFT_236927 [Rhizopus microsporus]